MKRFKIHYLLSGVIIIAILWLLSWFLLTMFISSQEERGQFGDMFGAINSLFSGLALCGVAYTLYLQQASNKSSEYQFHFTHMLDIVNRQVNLFNGRIIQFSFFWRGVDGDRSFNFYDGLSFYSSIKNNPESKLRFIKHNEIRITEILTFIYDSNHFVYNYINKGDLTVNDKSILKLLYERGLDRLVIDFVELCGDKLLIDRDEIDSLSVEMKPIFTDLLEIKRHRLSSIVSKDYN